MFLRRPLPLKSFAWKCPPQSPFPGKPIEDRAPFGQWMPLSTSFRSHNHSMRWLLQWPFEAWLSLRQVKAQASLQPGLLRSRTNWQDGNKEPKHSGDQMTLGRRRLKSSKKPQCEWIQPQSKTNSETGKAAPWVSVIFLTHVWSQADACTDKKANNNNRSS